MGIGTMARLSERQCEALAKTCSRHGVTLCYLFGSRASGFADATSDWDIGVVLEARPTGPALTGQWLVLVEALEGVFPSQRVDLLLLQDVPARLQSEAIHGEILYARDDTARADFEEGVMRRWMDLRPFIEAQERDEEEAILSGHFFAERTAHAVASEPDPPVATAACRAG